jgi:exonuclease VII small subunit
LAIAAPNPGAGSQTIGEREAGTKRLEEAVAAYRLALEEWTRGRVPLDWAKTQMNLGGALTVLGQRESGTTHLEEAVAAWDLGLQETAMLTEREGAVRAARDEMQAEIARRKGNGQPVPVQPTGKGQ